MYYPYLRGKQFELLALKELSTLLGAGGVTTPILEAVRAPTGSGLGRCISALDDARVGFVLVLNPSVGELRSASISPAISDFVTGAGEENDWNLGLLVGERSEVLSLVGDFSERFGPSRRLTLIHRGISDVDALAGAIAPLNCVANVIDDRLRRRHFRALLESGQGVTLRDGFQAAERNAEYLGREESVFTEEHLYYAEDGWTGFSDFLTIGEGYSEGGFTPRAVAIHWTFEREPAGPIMIRHFTSETNGDTSNVGGKFLEAAEKLVEFLDSRQIHTLASEVVRDHLAKGTYPGLGIVKKLSIQNHLEVVSQVLAR